MPHRLAAWYGSAVHGLTRDSSGKAGFGGRAIERLLEEARVSTPAYVYDLDGIRRETQALDEAFGDAPHIVAYAVKANSASTIVRAIGESGGGADVVSAGELDLALASGIVPNKIVMSGVAKGDDEIDRAIATGIRAIQLESVEEAERVAARAASARQTTGVSIRLNPSVEIDSHAHIATGHDEAKFGVAKSDVARAWAVVDAAAELRAVGVSTHVGSMLREPGPYVESARAVCDEAHARAAAEKPLEFVDFGGGFGVDYGGAPVEPPAVFARAALGLLRDQKLEHLTLVVEPGRSLVGAHGVLVARVIQAKKSAERRWLLLDAGMNDFIRPALYESRHRIEPLERAPGGKVWRVVGPVCESADDFGEHELGDDPPSAILIRDTGAYGFTMASEYNGRAVPAEVFVAGGRVVKVNPSPGRKAWVEARLRA